MICAWICKFLLDKWFIHTDRVKTKQLTLGRQTYLIIFSTQTLHWERESAWLDAFGSLGCVTFAMWLGTVRTATTTAAAVTQRTTVDISFGHTHMTTTNLSVFQHNNITHELSLANAIHIRTANGQRESSELSLKSAHRETQRKREQERAPYSHTFGFAHCLFVILPVLYTHLSSIVHSFFTVLTGRVWMGMRRAICRRWTHIQTTTKNQNKTNGTNSKQENINRRGKKIQEIT